MNRSGYTCCLFLSLILFFLASCSEKVEVQLGETEPRIVIEGYLSTETDSSYVRISKTISYFSKDAPPEISDGLVEINDGANSLLFSHAGGGVYRPAGGYAAESGKQYRLKVIAEGREFSSQSVLYPMFYVDSNLIFEFRPAEGFFSEGYSVTYLSNDSRPELIYTKFNFGQNDTLFDQSIIFSNADIVKYQLVPFELPFFRPQSGDSVMLVFRSMEKSVADYLAALSNLNSGAPGPFQTPPANPPTNISGGAIGYFMASDVVRIGKVVP
jgi:hypothetical protein